MRHPILPALAAVLILAASALAGRAAAADRRCFAETDYCVEGRILEFWEQNGGLPVFGLPISPQRQERVEGRTLTVQWFERNRLELHPDRARPYDVQIGRVGVELLERQGRDWRSFPRGEPRAGCLFFPETSQQICEPFLGRWRRDGLEFDGRPGPSEAESLALFGLPVSAPREETLSDGRRYTVQWFERARIELHPENSPPFDLLLGLLGAELRSRQPPRADLTGVPTSTRPPTPTRERKPEPEPETPTNTPVPPSPTRPPNTPTVTRVPYP